MTNQTVSLMVKYAFLALLLYIATKNNLGFSYREGRDGSVDLNVH